MIRIRLKLSKKLSSVLIIKKWAIELSVREKEDPEEIKSVSHPVRGYFRSHLQLFKSTLSLKQTNINKNLSFSGKRCWTQHWTWRTFVWAFAPSRWHIPKWPWPSETSRPERSWSRPKVRTRSRSLQCCLAPSGSKNSFRWTENENLAKKSSNPFQFRVNAYALFKFNYEGLLTCFWGDFLHFLFFPLFL